MKPTLHTPFLQVVPQRHGMDCGVACLAMMLGISYEAALIALRLPDVMTKGAGLRQIQSAARRLGVPLQFRRSFDLEVDTGILWVRADDWNFDHLVVLKDGLIVDTDSMIWDVDCFLSAFEATPIGLLTREV